MRGVRRGLRGMRESFAAAAVRAPGVRRGLGLSCRRGSAPTATAVPTVTAPPVAGTRRRPGQTCDDARLRELEKLKAAACAPKWTCGDSFEKKGRPDEKLLTCAELLARIPISQACVAARRLVQTERYAGSPDKNHDDHIQRLQKGVDECTNKADARGCN